jgi:hypothetical protein
MTTSIKKVLAKLLLAKLATVKLHALVNATKSPNLWKGLGNSLTSTPPLTCDGRRESQHVDTDRRRENQHVDTNERRESQHVDIKGATTILQ